MDVYSPEVRTGLYYVYGIAIIVWIFIVIYFRLYTVGGSIILWIPIIAFLVGLYNINDLTVEVEDEMFKTSYLSVGLLLALPLLTWMNKDYEGDKAQFTCVIVIAMCLTLLTFIDVWVPRGMLSVYKHARSCLQTMTISLLIYALVTYYLSRRPGPIP